MTSPVIEEGATAHVWASLAGGFVYEVRSLDTRSSGCVRACFNAAVREAARIAEEVHGCAAGVRHRYDIENMHREIACADEAGRWRLRGSARIVAEEKDGVSHG